MSGDFVGHGVATKPNVQDPKIIAQHYSALKDIMSTLFTRDIETYFNNTVVLPSIGNNDIKFHYQYPVTEGDRDDLYGFLFHYWFEHHFQNVKSLDLESIRPSFMRGGYYKTEAHGLTFIHLNTLMWEFRNLDLLPQDYP